MSSSAPAQQANGKFQTILSVVAIIGITLMGFYSGSTQVLELSIAADAGIAGYHLVKMSN